MRIWACFRRLPRYLWFLSILSLPFIPGRPIDELHGPGTRSEGRWEQGPAQEAGVSGAGTGTYLMGAIGDSISAASLADTSAVSQSATKGRSPAVALTPGELSARSLYENKGTFSWASGQDILSHFELLSSYLQGQADPSRLEVLNEAVPGDTTDDIGKQVGNLVWAMNGGQYSALKYVTLMIGANDACSTETPEGTPDARMRQNLMNFFAELAWIHQAEPIHVLVSSLPNIPQLGRPEIRDHSTLMGMSCEEVRSKILGFCTSLTTWNGEAEYESKLAIVEDKNHVLNQAVQDASAQYPSLRIVYSSSLFKQKISIDMLAADCFHPNQAGQQMLSELLWRDQPWFGPGGPG